MENLDERSSDKTYDTPTCNAVTSVNDDLATPHRANADETTNDDDMQNGDVNHQPPLHCWLVLVSIWLTDSVPEHSI
jgi:hypothetical protein